MATLVLTAVGNFVGGPIGATIGALIGQQIDGRIFAPKAAQGPRLKELAVQTSQYGAAVPALFGRMRVAGTITWSTDLIESKNKSGGGKGRPSTVQYSYRVSFAVALSSRRALRLGRIWADGRIIREEGGPLAPGGTLRFYSGAGEQMPDPLIAADVGADQCPAYRGLAYAVVEDLPLGDFGNRIPSLTFEVIADEAAVRLSDIAAYFTGGALVLPADGAHYVGFAAEGDSLDALIGPLLAAEGHMLAPSTTPVTIPDVRVVWLNNNAQDEDAAAVQAAPTPPAPLALRYYDPARDYQIALQRSRTGDHARAVASVDVPAAMTTDAAYALAEGMAQRAGRAAQIIERILPEILADSLPVGARFAIAGAGALWQVSEREWLNGAVRITAQPARGAAPVGESGAAGLGAVAGLNASGETQFVALELPPITPQTPAVMLVAAGTEAGWRGAMAYASVSGVDTPLGWIARGAVMGALAQDLPAHNGLLVDTGTLTVELLHADMELPSGANTTAQPLLWVAGEVMSYATATPETATRWRLSGLTRALYNSAAPERGIGARVVLLEGDMPHWPLDTAALPLGQSMAFTAEGAGDIAPATAALTLTHLSRRPSAPVHGRAVRSGGALTLSWHRRTRAAHLWQDFTDAPLSESTERYRVAFVGSTTAALESTAPMLTLSQIPAGATAVDIRQIGDFGASDPLIIAL